jgi:restriction system protein
MDNTFMTIGFIVLLMILSGFVFRKGWPKQNKLHRRNQAKAKKLLKQVQENTYPPAYIFGMLRKINPFVFEELLLLCFEQQGFKVIKNKRYTNDGGIDGAFYDKSNNIIVIQAKRYQSAINPVHITNFANTIKKHNATAGLFIHTGRTGLKSYQNLTNEIKIISGNELLKLLQVKINQTEKTKETNWQKRGVVA